MSARTTVVGCSGLLVVRRRLEVEGRGAGVDRGLVNGSCQFSRQMREARVVVQVVRLPIVHARSRRRALMGKHLRVEVGHRLLARAKSVLGIGPFWSSPRLLTFIMIFRAVASAAFQVGFLVLF